MDDADSNMAVPVTDDVVQRLPACLRDRVGVQPDTDPQAAIAVLAQTCADLLDENRNLHGRLNGNAATMTELRNDMQQLQRTGIPAHREQIEALQLRVEEIGRAQAVALDGLRSRMAQQRQTAKIAADRHVAQVANLKAALGHLIEQRGRLRKTIERLNARLRSRDEGNAGPSRQPDNWSDPNPPSR